ncbi:MAG TPA: PEP-CTERM sorting domain-containing protein [Phycisphaerae bacterium]|jgi:hypothetical protein|nr:PEP-CTERM sorting domain-containing protein [Phycisphaerae bacterium]
MKVTPVTLALFIGVLAVPLHGLAATIGVNFVGGSSPGNVGSLGGGPVNAMASAEVAGVVPQAFWNGAGIANQSDTTVNRAGTLSALVDSGGAAVPFMQVEWASNNTFSTTLTDSAGNNRLMKGYLDSSGALSPYTSSTSSVKVSSLPQSYAAGGFDLIVYFDGASTAGIQDRIGQYQLFDGTSNTNTPLGEIFGRDVWGVDFSGTFIQATGASAAAAGAGNYIRFTGLHTTSFTLLATGVAADVPRAPINGFQIVAVPEPSALCAMLASCCVMLIRRRRGI